MAWSSGPKSLLTVFVFSILAVSSVGSYECTESQCGEEPCPSPLTCTAKSGCFSLIQKFYTQSPTTDRMFKEKGCVTDTCSNLEFSATLGDQRRFNYSKYCCESEQCNKDDQSVTETSSSPNGVECPACYSEKESCSSVTTLKCTGEEKKCVEVTGTGTEDSTLKLYGKGCATENACNLDVKVLNSIQIKSKCISNSGNPTLKSISSIPIILLLLKVFL